MNTVSIDLPREGWEWNAEIGAWVSTGGSYDGVSGNPVVIADTAPTDASEGDLWFCTQSGSEALYCFDGQYWFETSSGYDDAQLSQNLTAETQARIAGDSDLQDQIDAFENYDDSDLQNQIDELVEEAPTSGLVYGRANGDWVAIDPGEGGVGGGGGAGTINLKYDDITPNGGDTYTLAIGGEPRESLGATNLLVSVNGTIQESGEAYTTSGTEITFSENLTSEDVIDFVVELTNGSYWTQEGLNLSYDGPGTKVIADQLQVKDAAQFDADVNVTGNVTAAKFIGDGSELDNLPAGSQWLNNGDDIYYNDGNVGIGTNDPKGRLHVQNDVGGALGRIIIDANVSSGYETRIDATDTGLEFTAASNSRDIVFNSGSTPKPSVTIKGDTGDVGIGTDDPQRKFHSKATQQVGAVFEATGNRAYVGFLDVNRDDQGGQYGPLVGSSGNNFVIATGAGNSERVRVDVAGNVGIGEDDPQALLHVSSANSGFENLANFGLIAGRGLALGTYNPSTRGDQAGVIAAQDVSGELRFRTGGNTDAETRLTINKSGNVGIGLDPTTGTFDLSAKEQLAEWKTKAKKASWEIVTDGEFSQEPTEELVEQWIETKAVGDRLQVDGNISSTGSFISGKKLGVTAVAPTVATDEVYETVRLSANDGSTTSQLRILNETSDGAVNLYCYAGGGTSQGSLKISARNGSAGDVDFLTLAKGTGNATFFGTVTSGTYSDASSNKNIGATLYPQGAISATRDSTNAALVLRQVSNGADIARFYGPTSGTNYNDHVASISGAGGATFSGTVSVGAPDDGFALQVNPGAYDATTEITSIDYGNMLWAPLNIKSEQFKVEVRQSSGSFGTSMILTDNDRANFSGTVKAPTFDGTVVRSSHVIQDGAPVIDAKGLITTLSTLRNATKDETTLEGLRDSIGNAIGGLIEKFEAEIAAMPAPEPEIETMPASSEETE